WGAQAPQIHPPDPGGSSMQGVLLEDLSAGSANPDHPSLMGPVLAPIAVADAAPDLPAWPTDPADFDGAPQPSRDHPGLAALYGRYTGQIHARIDRVWQRPRTPLGDANFHCETEIMQDHNGRIIE